MDDNLYCLSNKDFQWEQELCSDLIIASTEKNVNLYEEFQKFFNNTKFQWEDHEEACIKLDMNNLKIFCLQLMKSVIILKPWQPVAVNTIIKFKTNKLLSEAILTDVVNLEKT
ncbi:predicted protein [Uncinocarpus reesii 1704]|uniref:Uncharacterized protein n=1 Tax=Uncinocarpus reesii (strain UAMH 1704) TaxID=336963 RepID=C4JU03_UNCRE|nr:uncharacterized protein UREG_05942 [Uncinocarpus reesii 1704]EEP81100.1 predicted protein [Uncinocarpus reesii 1704]